MKFDQNNWLIISWNLLSFLDVNFHIFFEEILVLVKCLCVNTCVRTCSNDNVISSLWQSMTNAMLYDDMWQDRDQNKKFWRGIILRIQRQCTIASERYCLPKNVLRLRATKVKLKGMNCLPRSSSKTGPGLVQAISTLLKVKSWLQTSAILHLKLVWVCEYFQRRLIIC